MREVYDFLTANTTVFLASSDGGHARVRPFQFQFEEDGRLWFCTARTKDVFAQLQAAPQVELACLSPNMVTLRLQGAVTLDDDAEVKKRIIESNGLVQKIYGSADNPDFTVFSIDHGTAFMFDMAGNPPRSFSF